jgi:hypothetical protein
MVQYPWPIAVGLLTSFIIGAASWLPSAKKVELLGTIIIASCILIWALLDAQAQKRKIGKWQGLGILLLHPIGLLIYFMRTRGWSFYRPYLVYLALLALNYILTLTGFFAVGFYFGHTFTKLTH